MTLGIYSQYPPGRQEHYAEVAWGAILLDPLPSALEFSLSSLPTWGRTVAQNRVLISKGRIRAAYARE